MNEDLVAVGAIERHLVEQEHQHLRHGLDRLRDLVAGWPWLTVEDASDGLVRQLLWAQTDLEPHFAWERTWVYPELDRLGGSPWVTRLLRRRQERLLRRIETLEAARRGLVADTSRIERQAVGLSLAAVHAELDAHIDDVEHLLDGLEAPATPATVGRASA